MKKKNIINFSITIFLFLLFVVFSLNVKFFDVAGIGPSNSSVGFNKLNKSFFELIGQHDIMLKISDLLGYLSFVVVFAFFVVAIIQLVKRKNLKKIDWYFWILICFYLIVLICYMFFEIVIINYRPVLIDGVLEASYPSSHSFIFTSILISSIFIFNKLVKKSVCQNLYMAFSILVSGAIVLCRMMSGAHWITDIIGGVLLSVFLIMLFYSCLTLIEQRKINQAEKEKSLLK